MKPSYRFDILGTWQLWVATILMIPHILTWASQDHCGMTRVAESDWPVKRGYVAFGDSYAAGMGTGTTTGNGCRVGSNNFGALLSQYNNNASIKYNQKQCSGDTLVGLNRQIDEWLHESPEDFDIATISIGGNDLHFSDFVIYCVIGQFFEKDKAAELRRRCIETEENAVNAMIDTGPEGLPANLAKAYKKVLDYAWNTDFHLCVTGYPAFFNHDNHDCDNTTFNWHNPMHTATSDHFIKLSIELRREINSIMERMNSVIQRSVVEANRMAGSERVHYVDVNRRFDGHRWCEFGSTEPQPDRADTWFFLSAWPDYEGDTQAVSMRTQDRIDGSQLSRIDGIALPDPSTCRGQLGSDPDPWRQWQCYLAQEVADDPYGPLARSYDEAKAALAFGNVNAQHVSWWYPTRWIKSFHPRTRGMCAYRDALVDTIHYEQVQRLRACPIPPQLPLLGRDLPDADPNDRGPRQTLAGPAATESYVAPKSGIPVDGALQGSSPAGQIVAIASYIYPDKEIGRPIWDRMINYDNNKVGILVANVLNGPDSMSKPAWESVLAAAARQKKRILGYVRTGYLGLSPSDPGPFEPFVTRLGSTKVSDWIAQVNQDINMWYKLYGKDKIGGIFLDEGFNECTKDGHDAAKLYQFITATIKMLYPGAMVVLNPGTAVPSCYEESADILLTYESNYTYYISERYDKIKWTPKSPRKIWHIIYDVPESEVVKTIDLARKNGAGYVQVTDALMPNPYKTLPSDVYMRKVVNAVAGGSLAVGGASVPSQSHGGIKTQPILRITGHDHTSVGLSWEYSGSKPDAFAISTSEQNGFAALIPSSFSATTNGGLPWGKDVAFQVYAWYGDSTLSPASATQQVRTTDMLGNPVSEVKITQGEDTVVYEAQIVIPAGYVRIFLTSPHSETSDEIEGWPLEWRLTPKLGGLVTAHHMIEGRTLFRNTEPPVKMGPRFSANWGWAPTDKLDNVKVVRNRYSYKWEMPFDKSKIRDPLMAVIQTEGYGPTTNMFTPCPSVLKPENMKSMDPGCSGLRRFDCEGHAFCYTEGRLGNYCFAAAELLEHDRVYQSGLGLNKGGGTCNNDLAGTGCKIYVQGNKPDGQPCKFTGSQMRDAYEYLIKENEGVCSHNCGTKHFEDRCMVSVDYSYFCHQI